MFDCCSLFVQPPEVLNGQDQNPAETDGAEQEKDIEGCRTFDEDGMNQEKQQAKHGRGIAEEGDDEALATLGTD